MPITKEDIEKLFAVDDIVDSGGQRTQFRIIAIDDDAIRIQPTQGATEIRLRYDKLSVVVDSFENIDPQQIERSVGEVLKQQGLNETQAEGYLYGFAREYLRRVIAKYINANEAATAFLNTEANRTLSEEAFVAFAEEYQQPDRGAKFSERVFTYWICREFESNGIGIKYCPQLRRKTNIESVEKIYDLVIKAGDLEIMFEFKCNIDMVEKDIFKYMITSTIKNKTLKVLFVWERIGHANIGYTEILNYALAQNWIDKYFYFPIYKNKDDKHPHPSLKEAITDLKNHIKTWLN